MLQVMDVSPNGVEKNEIVPREGHSMDSGLDIYSTVEVELPRVG